MTFDNRTWVHHPEFGSKITTYEEAEVLYSAGWFDTPAKFPANQPQAEKQAESAPVVEANQAKRGRKPKGSQ